jgi:PAS domain S-box-containing protein
MPAAIVGGGLGVTLHVSARGGDRQLQAPRHGLEQRSPSTTADPGHSLLAHLSADEQAAALALLRATSHISALFDDVGTVRWVSDSITAVLGYTPEQFVGTSVFTYLHPNDTETVVGLLEFGAVNPTDGGLDRDDAETSADFRMRHHDGRWVVMEVLFNNFVATPGIRGSLTIAREATARHAFDGALVALARDTGSDEPLRRLLAYLEMKVSGTDAGLYWPDGDDQWTATSIDPELRTSDGPWVEALKRREYVVVPDLRQPGADLVQPDLAAAAVAAGYVACWSVPIPAPRHPRSAGRSGPGHDRDPLAALVLWSRSHREPLIGHLGTIEQVAVLAHLCLSRREADRERAARLAMELEQNRRLQELDAMRTDLVLSVSHELRTPLTSIISFADLLDDDPATRTAEDGAQYASIIKRNAERLLRLVGDLLFLGRLEAGIAPLTIGPVDLPGTVAAAVEEVRPAADAKGVVIRSETGHGRPFSGDPERIRQLVDNLLSNAVKYTDAGGSIRISARPTADADGWRLVVADDGIGIPPDEVGQVFDRFYRGSNARSAQIAGSGLGLVIAQAVATLHHGSIELSSDEGRGSTFDVLLRGA